MDAGQFSEFLWHSEAMRDTVPVGQEPAQRPPHEERVLREHEELAEKAVRLRAFVKGEVFKGLPGEQKELLVLQELAMLVYQMVLEMRINRFPAVETKPGQVFGE